MEVGAGGYFAAQTTKQPCSGSFWHRYLGLIVTGCGDELDTPINWWVPVLIWNHRCSCSLSFSAVMNFLDNVCG